MVLCGPGGSIKLPAVLRGHDSHRALAAERVVDEREQTTIKSGVRDSLYAWLHKISAKHRRHEPHVGARAGSRTLNLGIKSPLLCQLSYASAIRPTVDSKVPRVLTAGVPPIGSSYYGAYRAGTSTIGCRPRGQVALRPHPYTPCLLGAGSARRLFVVVVAMGAAAGSCGHLFGSDRTGSGCGLGSLAGPCCRRMVRRYLAVRHQHPSGGMEERLDQTARPPAAALVIKTYASRPYVHSREWTQAQSGSGDGRH